MYKHKAFFKTKNIKKPDALRLQPIVSRIGSFSYVGFEILSSFNFEHPIEEYFNSLPLSEMAHLFNLQLNIAKNLPKRFIYTINIPVRLLLKRTIFDSLFDNVNYSKNIIVEIQDPKNMFGLSCTDRMKLINSLAIMKSKGIITWVDDVTLEDIDNVAFIRNYIEGIKIDKTSFWQCNTAKELDFIVNIYRKVTKYITVEGVENVNQIVLARDAKVDFLQGHFWPEVLVSL